MAIHPTVFWSADRRWRITADVTGNRFTVERDRSLMGTFSSLPELETFLREHGIGFADLEQD